MQSKILSDETFSQTFAGSVHNSNLSISYLSFYRSLRENVIPVLNLSFINIACSCSTGEEAYLCRLFAGRGLYDRTTIYATDFNQQY